MANDPKREEIYGSNKRSERKGVSYWYLIWIGMHDFTMILLTISATISIILGIKTEGWDDGWYDGIAIIAAILTPPDAVSQCMLAIPMILLYEVAAQLARLVKPKKPAEA